MVRPTGNLSPVQQDMLLGHIDFPLLVEIVKDGLQIVATQGEKTRQIGAAVLLKDGGQYAHEWMEPFEVFGKGLCLRLSLIR